MSAYQFTDDSKEIELCCAALRNAGVVILRKFFSPSECDIIARESERLGEIAQRCLSGKMTDGQSIQAESSLIAVAEASDTGRLSRFEGILGASPALRELVRGRLEKVVSVLAGRRMIPFKDKENCKYPHSGGYGPHQDMAAYQSFGPTYHVTAMISVDAMSAANGCLAFADGYTKAIEWDQGVVLKYFDRLPLYKFKSGGPNNGDIIDVVADHLVWTKVETSFSDLVLFDSLVPHKSDPNRSGRPRRAMFFTFSSESEGDWYERYYALKRKNPTASIFHISTPTLHDSTIQ